jgi:hypothetical protein
MIDKLNIKGREVSQKMQKPGWQEEGQSGESKSERIS